MAEFTYHRPARLTEAGDLMATLPGARLLAGGTDLLNDLDAGLVSAQHVISLRDIPELGSITERADSIAVGAGCTIAAIEASPVIHKYFPELLSVGLVFATPQVKHRATLGGNICSAVACGDFPVILTALQAEVTLYSAEGTRSVPMREFPLANRKTCRRDSEILTEIIIPKKPPAALARYEKFRRRAAGSLAVASVAVYLDLDGTRCRQARIVLGAVAPSPVNAVEAAALLQQKDLTPEVIRQAADLARKAARPITDVRATAEYRRELIFVLTQRALRAMVGYHGEIR
ncbi:MAG: xanthine dehydrogenase family protein subunit M [FCB group bacterium]|nr:xanthine dehydrogenase family protein subunit M [FCB group bacterium]